MDKYLALRYWLEQPFNELFVAAFWLQVRKIFKVCGDEEDKNDATYVRKYLEEIRSFLQEENTRL